MFYAYYGEGTIYMDFHVYIYTLLAKMTCIFGSFGLVAS
jgi:hypothetical protein